LINDTLTGLGSSKDRLLQLSCYLKGKEWFDTVHRLALEWTGNKLQMEIALVDGFAREDMLLEVEATAFL